MKKNGDIIITVVGVLVLIIGLCVYFFAKSNYFNKEVENILIEEIEDTGEIEFDVPQFLTDTKDLYCGIVELRYYVDEAKDELKKSKLDLGSKFRIISKKALSKNDILGLSGNMLKYVDKYSDSQFPKSVRLLSLTYEYNIKRLESMKNIKEGFDSFYEDTLVFNQTSNEAADDLYLTIIDEYKKIRGDDKTLRPEDESILLDLKNICRKNVDESLSE